MGHTLHRMAVAAALMAAGAALAGQTQPAGQAPSPPGGATFRAVANYVEVDVSVTDASGNFVRDLTADDFTIAESGQSQPLSVCALVDIPLEQLDRPLYRRTVVEPDVASNADVDHGRMYLIVLDGYHVSPQKSSEVRRQAARFIDRYLGVNDLAAVAVIGDPVAGQEFTSAKSRLLAAVNRFQGQKPVSASVAAVQSGVSVQNTSSANAMAPGVSNPEGPYRAYLAIAALQGLQQLVEGLSGVTGRRKAMVLFSEGVDYDTLEQTIQGTELRVQAAESAMIGAATRANVIIYPIDPRGLTAGNEEAIQIGAVQPGDAVPVAAMQDELLRAHESLRAFAGETGGRAALESNDLDAVFDRVMRDSSTYYVLGYNSASARDGRFHDVRVRVKRPGLDVRARQGYYAPFADGRERGGPARKRAEDPLDAALEMPIPTAGLGLRAHVAVVAAATTRLRTVHLTLETAPGSIGFEPLGALFSGGMDVAYRAYDANGTVQAAARKVIGLKLKVPNRDLVTRDGLRFLLEFDLPAGEYQLRLVGRDIESGRLGSLFLNLSVPEAGGPMALGDLLLSSARAAGIFTTGDAPAASGLMPTPTTALRRFQRSDVLTVAAPLQWGEAKRPLTADIRTVIRADDGTEVFVHEDRRDSRAGSNLASDTTVTEIPLAGLAPGRYVLSVEARPRVGGVPIVREVTFVVE